MSRTDPDALHPWAWWAWALGAGGAISIGSNPLQVALAVTAVAMVVTLRRGEAPWARALTTYLALAATILAIRLVFQILLGGSHGTTVVFTLPQIGLPAWAAGIRLGGPVTAEGLAMSGYDGLRMTGMLVALGAANALASPKRALRSVPAALFEASVAVVVALSLAPQLVTSAGRVRRARRLRGGRSAGWRAVTAVAVPILSDAVDSSLSLAASMEARGFGHRSRPAATPALGALMLASLLALTLGSYLVLSSATPLAGFALLAAGIAGAVWGLRLSGRRLSITRYRRDPWGLPAWLVAGSGAAAIVAASALAALAPAVANPGTDPLVWPPLHPAMLLLAALLLVPLAVTRPPRRDA